MCQLIYASYLCVLMKPCQLLYILCVVLSLACVSRASAFSPDIYAKSSVLKQGHWVKISVAESGMHLVSVSELRAWGFDNPEKVRVYGYGGKRIPDRLSVDNYTDDLPMVQSELTKRGIVFYLD